MNTIVLSLAKTCNCAGNHNLERPSVSSLPFRVRACRWDKIGSQDRWHELFKCLKSDKDFKSKSVHSNSYIGDRDVPITSNQHIVHLSAIFV